MILSVDDVLEKGLDFLSIRKRKSEDFNKLEFKKHYGSWPVALADQWGDLTDVLENKEKSEKGFKMFLVAHYFLWNYPKNASVLSSRFSTLCERRSRGEPLWKWIRKIGELKEQKIVWDPSLDDPEMAIFAVSVDGTDFRIWEPKHPLLNMDKKYCSQKFKHGAVKYEITLSVFHSKCVHIAGPYRGGMHDLDMFRKGGLKAKMKNNRKLAIADRGYLAKSKEEKKMFSLPDNMDGKDLKKFKSRARCRHETFNGRLKSFSCLEHTFHHGIDKHKLALEAVVVTVQYAMEHGSPIYDV